MLKIRNHNFNMDNIICIEVKETQEKTIANPSFNGKQSQQKEISVEYIPVHVHTKNGVFSFDFENKKDEIKELSSIIETFESYCLGNISKKVN